MSIVTKASWAVACNADLQMSKNAPGWFSLVSGAFRVI